MMGGRVYVPFRLFQSEEIGHGHECKLNLSYPPQAPQGPVAPVVADKDKTKVEPAAPTTDKPQKGDLEKAVTDIKEFVQAAQRNLDFPLMIHP